uniref:sentrin-specific protease 2-like n=1 Tax=Arvicanthis niloticus TaxID=61156 RepID=UPI001486E62E|nr:sentrin-specific protease 2-like [Arvicanthis niloticus]
MWQPKQPGVDMKPEASRKAQKRKYPDNSGTETESEGLGQSTKTKCKDGTEMLFKEPGKAWKKTPQKQQDLKLEKHQPGKGQVQKAQEESPRQLKPIEGTKGPPEQAVPEGKPADARKGRKRPYSTIEKKEQSPPKEKHGRLSQKRDPERVRRCSEETSITQKKDGVNHGGRRGNSLEPDLPGTPALTILDSGRGDRLLPNKMAVLAAEEKPLTNLEKGREVDQNFHVTEDMEKEIRSALGPGPQEEILSRGFKLQITRRDIQTLKNGQWLNDEIINFYMNLLVERNENQGYPALHVFSTFFYPKLTQSGYSSVKRWTRTINLFDKEMILVPIHQRVHWSLVVIDLRKRNIVYLDSLGQTGKTICETIFQYLQNESKTRRNIELDPLEWKLYSMSTEEIPQQLNGSDCGMFACKYADYIARDQPVTFSQQHMPIFRKRMVWEILHSHLL